MGKRMFGLFLPSYNHPICVWCYAGGCRTWAETNYRRPWKQLRAEGFSVRPVIVTEEGGKARE